MIRARYAAPWSRERIALQVPMRDGATLAFSSQPGGGTGQNGSRVAPVRAPIRGRRVHHCSVKRTGCVEDKPPEVGLRGSRVMPGNEEQ